MIKTINGWRAIFALMIVLFHVGVTGLEEATWAGVTFFLMASGFMLAMKHPFEQLDKTSYRTFAWRHAMKLFPLHWLTLAMWIVGMALLGLLTVKPLTLALNTTLLHSWSLCHSIYFSFNKFSWFLSTLLFCYLCYPLLARWYQPLPWRTRLIIVAALIIVDFTVLAFTDDYSRTALYVFPPVRLIDFIIGMTLASGSPRLQKSRFLGKSPTGTDAELVSIALLSAIIMTYRTTGGHLLPWSDAVLWWLPVGVILLVCVFYDRREGLIGRLLASRPLQWLGNISFEIFMLQGIAALIYNYWVAPVLGHFGITRILDFVCHDIFGNMALNHLALFILPIDILLAWLVNRLFTRPLRRLLRSNK